jgi:hypothetical protein
MRHFSRFFKFFARVVGVVLPPTYIQTSVIDSITASPRRTKAAESVTIELAEAVSSKL